MGLPQRSAPESLQRLGVDHDDPVQHHELIRYEDPGEYELFKTSTLFDVTAQNPEWLGEEPKRLQALAG